VLMYLLCHVKAMADGLNYRQQEKTRHSADTHSRRDSSVTAIVVVVVVATDRKMKEMCD
jgi:hypothetical protein